MTTVALLVRKDLRVLARSPLLLGALIAYPLLIALLLGLVAGYANAKPRVALVDEDGLPAVVEVGGRRFHVDRTIARVSNDVTLVPLDADEAERQLRSGKVVAVVTVPPGFVAELQGMVRSPRVSLETSRGILASRVTQQMQALVYALNRQLQDAYIAANLEYIDLIREGGTGYFLGRRFDLLGLRRTQQVLEHEFPPSERLAEIKNFVGVAELALDQTDEALRATANPIELDVNAGRGRTWALSAQVQAYALALTTIFIALVLAAGALAAERDENTIGRLVRGLASPTQLVAAKVALAAVVAAALGLGVATAFGAVVELGGVEGGEPWDRFPLLLIAIALAGAAAGALGTFVGALAKEGRAATLAAVLVVLPVVFVGVVPREVAPVAGRVSDALPFAHAVRLFDALLYEADPWSGAAVEAAWLLALGCAYAVAARLACRRLSS